MTYFSAGCKISSVNNPISSTENMIKNLSILSATLPVKWFGGNGTQSPTVLHAVNFNACRK
jgi:hypothetical protein